MTADRDVARRLEEAEANLKRERIAHRKSLNDMYRLTGERDARNDALEAEVKRLREALLEVYRDTWHKAAARALDPNAD